MSSSTIPSGSDCRVKVVCRVRPLNRKEKETSSFVVGFPSDTTVCLGGRSYTYDQVFQPDSTQKDVYLASAKPLVQDVLDGYNATIFAYGQTASGKTHTMEGVLDDEELYGIIPRIVDDMFEQLYSMDSNVEVHIKVSYFEIYMEKIRDLLDISKVNLPIGETKRKVPYVKGVTERFVTMPEEVLEMIEEGKANRSVAVTNMNAHSSRSHAVFLISIKQEHRENHKTIFGKLYLVDLAGSEKVDKTNAQGLTLEEAKTINKSLLALSNVISALSEGNKPFIPYRDSKLTRVLQESLGGNARTTLVICCSPSSYNEPETKTTLMFGDRAKSIKNKVVINVELTAEEWRRRYDRLKDAHGKLRKTVDMCESELTVWRSGGEVSIDQQKSLSSNSSDLLLDSSIRSTGSMIPSDTITRTCSPSLQQDLEERNKLCGIIDEKDEMLRSQAELLERLTQQLHSLDAVHQTSEEENYTLRQDMAQISFALNISQTEVREVMQALEELAVSYDVKDKEIERSINAKQMLEEEVNKLQLSVECKSRELNCLQDTSHFEKRKYQERLSVFLLELGDIGAILGAKMEDSLRQVDSSLEFSDADFTKARIHLSNLRYEVRSLAKQKEVLEQAEKEARQKVHSAMGELNSCKTKMSQYEAQNKLLHSTLQDLEEKKEKLEGTMTDLKAQLIDLRKELLTKEGGEIPANKLFGSDKWPCVEEVGVVNNEVEVHRLRQEIAEKEMAIENITKQQESQQVAMAAVLMELEEMHKRYGENKEQLVQARRDRVVKQRLQHDLGGLTDTVSCEMECLTEIRDLYLHHMTSRLKNKSSDDETLLPSLTNTDHQFLEKNLEELDHAYKTTISENAEMSREIPRLRSVLANKSKRIGQLEHMIGETREAANSEYEKLRLELEQTKNSFLAKLKEKERENLHGRRTRRSSGITAYTDQLTGLSHNNLTTVTDPLTGLVQSGPREPRVVDQVTGLMMHEEGAVRRPGPTFGKQTNNGKDARPLPRRYSADACFSSRERLVAVAGVSLIGQRPKPSQLSIVSERSSLPAVGKSGSKHPGGDRVLYGKSVYDS